MIILLSLLALILILLPFSFYLLHRSLRGRPTGGHPTCARCSFDLFNRPETSTRCPECGSDLSAPRAIFTGVRRRSAFFVSFSLALLIVTTAACLLLPYRLITDPRLIPLQPTFILPLHFHYGPLIHPALSELQSRILTGQAPASSASGVVRRILFLQADPKAKWNIDYGNFIELLRQSSLLSDADWTTYLNHSAIVSARIRPDVRIGDPIPLEFTLITRVGRRTAICATCSGSATLDNQIPPFPEPWGDYGPNLFRFAPNPPPIQHIIPQAMYAHFSPGLHTAHITIELALGLSNDPPLKINQTFDLPFMLHPADHPTVRLLDEPALRDQVTRSIVITAEPFSSASSKTMLQLFAPDAPCALSYDVFVRSGNKFYGHCPVVLDKGSRNGFVISSTVRSTPLPEHVDVILHPNPARAITTVGITEICDGDIVLHNISTLPSKNKTLHP